MEVTKTSTAVNESTTEWWLRSFSVWQPPPTSYYSATAHCHCLGLPWEFGAYLSVKTYRLSDIDTSAHDVHAFLDESPKQTPLCPWKHMKTKSSDKYQSPGGSYPPFWSSRANISEFIFNKNPELFNRQSASLYTTYIPLSSHFLVGFWSESSLNIGESIGKWIPQSPKKTPSHCK